MKVVEFPVRKMLRDGENLYERTVSRIVQDDYTYILLDDSETLFCIPMDVLPETILAIVECIPEDVVDDIVDRIDELRE